MVIYFILCIIIQYYFILLLKLFQLWPLEALSVGSYILWSFCCCSVMVFFFKARSCFPALQNTPGSSCI